MYRRLTDNNVTDRGFSQFAASSVLEEGQAVRFVYPSGAAYDVPLVYILEWFRGCEDEHQETSRRPRRKLSHGETLRIVRSRKFCEDLAVRLYLNNGQTFDVPWDTVLMACEPRYQYFGGLTKQSKRQTEKTWPKMQLQIRRTLETEVGELSSLKSQ